MSQYQQPQHPATAYYPGYAPEPPKDLTVMGILAFATAALATLFTVVNATIVGRVLRHLDADDLDWSVAVYALGGVLAGLSMIGGWITAAMWLHRARKNAELLDPRFPHVRSAGWAWGGWVCPVVNLWFPYQVVRDTHRAVGGLRASVVGWWWAAFLFMTVGNRIASAAERDATAADASGVQTAEVFFALVTVVALVLWGMVLRRITKEQHARMYAAAVPGR